MCQNLSWWMRVAVVGLMAFPLHAAETALKVSASGHYFTYRGKTILLVGDSGTQCILQNLNVDYRRWVDDCAARGMTAIHVWSFVAPRQKQDGSVVESRWGYVYPGATPWKRRAGGPPAADQLPQWDLTQYDEGGDPTQHYWPRLRDLASRARDKGLVFGLTVFFGWPKHAEPQQPDWTYHPFNVKNGGHLTDNNAVQIIHSPGVEVLSENWSDAWPAAKKTQWIWERFSDKLTRDLNPLGNVFFVFMDEHSYSEGNCGDHFLRFFQKRGALWVDWSKRRRDVDAVYVETATLTDRNRQAIGGFMASPARPLLCLEGPPYLLGDRSVSGSMWTFAIGGGHFFFQDDCNQGTDQTGIMGYDSKVKGGRIPYVTYDWLGRMSRFFNEGMTNLDAMHPHNEIIGGGGANAYCLAAPGVEYAIYLPEGGTVQLNLEATKGRTFYADWYDPRTGVWTAAGRVNGGGQASFTPPANPSADWALRLQLWRD